MSTLRVARGLTLIEVIVSSTIFSLVILVALTTLNTATRSMSNGVQYIKSGLAASTILDRMTEDLADADFSTINWAASASPAYGGAGSDTVGYAGVTFKKVVGYNVIANGGANAGLATDPGYAGFDKGLVYYYQGFPGKPSPATFSYPSNPVEHVYIRYLWFPGESSATDGLDNDRDGFIDEGIIRRDELYPGADETPNTSDDVILNSIVLADNVLGRLPVAPFAGDEYGLRVRIIAGNSNYVTVVARFMYFDSESRNIATGGRMPVAAEFTTSIKVKN